MKAAQLRQAILQAAMQGRLVPQNPQDEPASALLERIQVEKTRFIEEGRIKKEKLFPPVTDDEAPYDLPEGWQWTRLGHVTITCHSGWSPQCLSHRRLKEEWGVLKVSSVSWGTFKPEENKALPPNIQPKTEFSVQMGDFLISRANTDELVARSVVVDKATTNLMLCDKIVRFHLSENVNKNFINNSNLSSLSRQYYIKHASGTSSTMKNVSREVMLNLPIPLPPLAEQHRIVARLNELMLLCDELEAAEKELDALESNLAEYLPKSILRAAVQGKLVPQNIHDEPASELLNRIRAEKTQLVKEGKVKKEKPLPPITEDEVPYDLPDGWEWCRLGDICNKIGSGSTPRGGKDVYVSTGIPFLRSQNVRDEGLDMGNVAFIPTAVHAKMSATSVFPKDILLNITGGSLGRCALVSDDFQQANVSQHVTIIRLCDSSLRRFIHFMLLSPYCQEMIWSRQIGMAREGLSKRTLEMFEIPIPPVAEQERIVAKIDELMALCAMLKNIDVNAALSSPSDTLPFRTTPQTIPQSEPEERYSIAARGELPEELPESVTSAIDKMFQRKKHG